MAAADLQGFLDEVDPFVLISEVSFLGMEAAVIFGKEIPSEHEVVDEVFNDATVHSHESPVNAKAYVDDAKRVDLAAINADGPSFVGLDLVFPADAPSVRSVPWVTRRTWRGEWTTVCIMHVSHLSVKKNQ